jgi:preprotein translocase subunit YajC
MAPGGSGGGGMSILLFQILAIGLVFYFLIVRPQGAARKRHAEMLAQLKKNDEVMTSGGIVGKVRDIKEVDVGSAKETRVTIESGTSTVVVERSRIVRVGTSVGPEANR